MASVNAGTAIIESETLNADDEIGVCREAQGTEFGLPSTSCEGQSCKTNEECAHIGCPGDACYYFEHWFWKTCHDRIFSEAPQCRFESI